MKLTVRKKSCRARSGFLYVQVCLVVWDQVCPSLNILKSKCVWMFSSDKCVWMFSSPSRPLCTYYNESEVFRHWAHFKYSACIYFCRFIISSYMCLICLRVWDFDFFFFPLNFFYKHIHDRIKNRMNAQDLEQWHQNHLFIVYLWSLHFDLHWFYDNFISFCQKLK